MPAPRTCRACGASLPPDIRWCTRCYAPVTEFATRPVSPGGFVGTPRHDRDDSGHWSRWEKTPTTFGPAGRLGGTIFIVAWLASGFSYTFVIFWLVELFLGGWLIRELWKPGWTVSAQPERRIETNAVEPLREGFRVPRPERVLHAEPTPIPRSTIAAWVGLGAIAIGATVLFVNGDEPMKMIVTTSATLVAAYLFFRSIFR